MKTVLISAIVATCLVVCAYGLPAAKLTPPRPANEEAVAEIALQIRRVVLVSTAAISGVAKNDSLEVGNRIEEKVNASRNEAVSIIDQLDASIAAATLDLEEANELLQQLNDTGVALQENIKEDVQELSRSAQAAIRGILIGSTEALSRLANALRALLSEGVSTQASDKSLARLSGELPDEPSVHTSNQSELLAKLAAAIRATINRLANEVNEIARNDNAEVGESIASVVNGARSSALEAVSVLDEAIANGSLTVEQASEQLAKLNEIDEQLQSDVAELASQLSLTARVAVKAVLVANSVAVRAQAASLLAVLAIGIPGGK